MKHLTEKQNVAFCDRISNHELEKSFNFGVVADGRLYRSCQPNVEFLDYLKKEYKIRTVVVLRIETDEAEEKFCRDNIIHFVQLPVKSWKRWPEPEEMKNFFDILGNYERWPVLIHCRLGKDRTSAAVALYRLKFENWKMKEAVDEMKQWTHSWFWQLFIQTSAHKVIEGFEEKNVVLLYLKRFFNLIFAFEGLAYALKHEKNLQIFLAFEVILLGFALWWGITKTEFIVLLIFCGILNALEMFNTAIERLVNLVQPKFSPKIKTIKDLLSGGVTFFGLICVFVWIILVFFL